MAIWSKMNNNNQFSYLKNKSSEVPTQMKITQKIYSLLQIKFNGNDEMMKKWLNFNHSELKSTPLNLLSAGKGELVLDFLFME